MSLFLWGRWCLGKCACACLVVSYGDRFQNVKTVGTWNTIDDVTRLDTLEVGLSEK